MKKNIIYHSFNSTFKQYFLSKLHSLWEQCLTKKRMKK